jgi:hypothetical protein
MGSASDNRHLPVAIQGQSPSSMGGIICPGTVILSFFLSHGVLFFLVSFAIKAETCDGYYSTRDSIHFVFVFFFWIWIFVSITNTKRILYLRTYHVGVYVVCIHVREKKTNMNIRYFGKNTNIRTWYEHEHYPYTVQQLGHTRREWSPETTCNLQSRWDTTHQECVQTCVLAKPRVHPYTYGVFTVCYIP